MRTPVKTANIIRIFIGRKWGTNIKSTTMRSIEPQNEDHKILVSYDGARAYEFDAADSLMRIQKPVASYDTQIGMMLNMGPYPPLPVFISTRYQRQH